MNMTPLIDVTFLLIIFFMVINNYIFEESVQMIVPELANPKVREFEQMNRVVINIAPIHYSNEDRRNNHLDWSGEAQYVKIANLEFSIDQMDLVTSELISEAARRPKDDQGDSTLEVVLRCDAAMFYDAVQPVMAAISRAGIGKVHLVSYLPDQGPSGARKRGP